MQKANSQGQKNKDAIAVLELYGYGKTLFRIACGLRKYPMAQFLRKYENNGAPEVHKWIDERGFNVGSITVCGVNSDACVKETAQSLARMGYEVYVVKKACNTDALYDNPSELWENYKKTSNMRLV